MARKVEKMLLKIMNECATFSKSLNLRNINKTVSDIRVRFPFESSFGYPYLVANSLSCRISNRQTG